MHAYAVLDGHGGSRASEFARHHLVPIVLDGIKKDMTNEQVSARARWALRPLARYQSVTYTNAAFVAGGRSWRG